MTWTNPKQPTITSANPLTRRTRRDGLGNRLINRFKIKLQPIIMPISTIDVIKNHFWLSSITAVISPASPAKNKSSGKKGVWREAILTWLINNQIIAKIPKLPLARIKLPNNPKKTRFRSKIISHETRKIRFFSGSKNHLNCQSLNSTL